MIEKLKQVEERYNEIGNKKIVREKKLIEKLKQIEERYNEIGNKKIVREK